MEGECYINRVFDMSDEEDNAELQQIIRDNKLIENADVTNELTIADIQAANPMIHNIARFDISDSYYESTVSIRVHRYELMNVLKMFDKLVEYVGDSLESAPDDQINAAEVFAALNKANFIRKILNVSEFLK